MLATSCCAHSCQAQQRLAGCALASWSGSFRCAGHACMVVWRPSMQCRRICIGCRACPLTEGVLHIHPAIQERRLCGLHPSSLYMPEACP